jgi:hypothetical protein
VRRARHCASFRFEAYLCRQFERVLAFAGGNPIDVVNPEPQAT